MLACDFRLGRDGLESGEDLDHGRYYLRGINPMCSGTQRDEFNSTDHESDDLE